MQNQSSLSLIELKKVPKQHNFIHHNSQLQCNVCSFYKELFQKHKGMQIANNSLNIQSAIIKTQLFSVHNFHHKLGNLWPKVEMKPMNSLHCNHVPNRSLLINILMCVNLQPTKDVPKAYLALGKDRCFLAEGTLNMRLHFMDHTGVLRKPGVISLVI